MVTQCKLLLGDVARQRHHAGIAIEGIFAAMKILKSVEIFADKKKSRLEQTRLGTCRILVHIDIMYC